MNQTTSQLIPALLPVLRQYGRHCMAYSTLQKGLEYEIYEGIGFIAYLSYKHALWCRKGIKIVLADPVCNVSQYQQVTQQFMDTHKDVVFMQASDTFAKVLDSMGYEVNQFGIETELPIIDFDLKGKHRSKLRQWRNKCQREGVHVREVSSVSEGLSNTAIQLLLDEWVKKKGGHEFTFLTRPLCFESEPDVRYFQAFNRREELIAIAVFDPMYSQGEVVGYYHNVDRISRVAPHGTSAYVILQAMEIFRAEGKKLISLGMSPLFGIKRTEYRYNDFFHEILFFTFKHLEFLYPFKGNAGHKKKFHGEMKRVFFASTKGNSLWQLLVTLKAIKLF